ncbi:MAG: ABC transporter permease [Saprospiraceae bacterium]
MLRNYITLAIRNLTRRGLFSLINITGVTIGIVSITLIFLYVQNELTYDHFHEKADRIFVLEENGAYPQTVFPALPELRREYPVIEDGTRILEWEQYWLQYGDKEVQEPVMQVDTGFFNVFSFPLLQGNAATALQNPGGIILSKEVADALFGKEDPIGKVLKTNEEKQYTVVGVLAPIPPNSSLRIRTLAPLTERLNNKDFLETANWYNSFSSTYLLLKPGTDPQALEKQLPDFIRRHYAEGAKDRTLAMLDFDTLYEKYIGNSSYIKALFWIAIFILVVVCINFINLTTAVSFSRMREVAVRRLIGSSKSQLNGLFLTESILVSSVATVLGLGLVQVSLKWLNEKLNLSLTLNLSQNYPLLLCLAGIILFLALCAGVYPAVQLATVNAIQALKGEMNKGRSNPFNLRNALIIIQFSIAIILIVGSLTVFRQIDFMKNADLNFNKENVLVLDLSLDYRDPKQALQSINQTLDDLRNHTQVKAFSTTSVIPGQYWENYNVFFPTGNENTTIRLRHSGIDDGYLTTYGIKLLAGRNFNAQLASDTAETKVLINKTAAKEFGWQPEAAVGKVLHSKGTDLRLEVVGVMDDFHYRSLDGEIEPILHYFDGAANVQNNRYLSIRLQPGSASSMVQLLEKRWKQIPSRLPLSYFFIDEAFNRQYESVERTLLLATIFTMVTILIACAGIFGLTILMVQKRVKEIGIRKVLGADVSSIVVMLSKDFLRLVLIAVLIATPLAWWAMNQWLEDFAYRVGIDLWVLILSGMLALFIAFATVSIQAIRAAVMNPVHSLRSE